MDIEIWSDVVCPWCFVGKRRFEAALARFPQRDEVEVVWRAFELDPSAPRLRPGPYDQRLAAKYGVSLDEAQAMIDRMVEAGRASGADLRFDLARPGNTFDAHRLLALARDAGRQDALCERLFRATFTEGAAIGERAELVRLGTEAGLDADIVSEALAGDAFATEVREDEAEAARLGIRAVPFFVIDRAYGIAGAQPPDQVLAVLHEAWSAAPDVERAPG